MPVIIDKQGESRQAQHRVSLREANYPYTYPEGLDLKPGSPTHDRLRDEIMRRLRDSKDRMTTRHSTWRDLEWTLKAYIPLDAEEERRRERDSRKPVSIVVPVSWATRETICTYLLASFTAESPMIQYEGRGPEDVFSVALLELLVDYQRQRKKWELALLTQWMDSLTYGFGVVTPTWRREIGYRVQPKPQGVMDFLTGLFMETGEPEKELVEYVSFEGHRLDAIDPWLYFPDPHAPAHLPEDMEYVGWLVPTNAMALLAEEKNTGSLFNGLYVKHLGDARSHALRSGDRDPAEPRQSGNPVDVAWMYWNLIPSEYGLGDSIYPEPWIFALAGDEVLVQARRLKLAHNRFPVTVCCPDTDGRTAVPTSRLEVGYGLQHVTNWLINNHVANLTKSTNNVYVFDPSIINAAAMQAASEAGGLIPTRRSTWGRPIKDGIMQLPVNDVTARNVQDADYLMQVMNRVTGATDIVQGMMREGGERRSALEARGARSAALSRLEKTAKMISIQSMRDLGYIVGSQTQQFMSEGVALQVLGRTAEKLARERGILPGSYINVDPFAVLCDFDVIVRDGTIPNPDNADTLLRMFEIISSSPAAVNWRLNEIILAIARESGIKDFDAFEVQTTVMDDAALQAQVQAGNMRPVEQAA
jgi:hypothetical protein